MNGVESEFHAQNAAVPQGIVLSLTLFLVFINDFLSSTFNSIQSFTDDLTLDFAYSFDSLGDSRHSTLRVNRERLFESLNDDSNKLGAKQIVFTSMLLKPNTVSFRIFYVLPAPPNLFLLKV